MLHGVSEQPYPRRGSLRGLITAYARSAFILVHLGVSAGEEFLHRLAFQMLRQSKRGVHSQLHWAGLPANSVVSADPFLNAVGPPPGHGHPAVEQDDELVASPAANHVSGAAPRLQFGGKFQQQFIADHVSMIVVHLFESVDIDDGDTKRKRHIHPRLYLAFHGKAAAKPGQRIVGSDLFGLLELRLETRHFNPEFIDGRLSFCDHPAD